MAVGKGVKLWTTLVPGPLVKVTCSLHSKNTRVTLVYWLLRMLCLPSIASFMTSRQTEQGSGADKAGQRFGVDSARAGWERAAQADSTKHSLPRDMV